MGPSPAKGHGGRCTPNHTQSFEVKDVVISREKGPSVAAQLSGSLTFLWIRALSLCVGVKVPWKSASAWNPRT